MSEPLAMPGSERSYIVPAAFAAGAGAIHASVIQAHLLDGVAYGVFFAVVAGLQVLWALLITASPSRRQLVTGAVANLGVAVIWVLSRTVGLPGGAHPWEAEPITALDATATALEVGVFVLVMLRLPRVRQGTIPVGLALVAIATSAAVIAWSEPHLHLTSRNIDPDKVRQAALAGTTDGEIITAPLYGGYVEAFVEEIVAGPNAVHVGFFSRGGEDRTVTHLELISTAPDGTERALETRPLAPSHYVARVRLAAGTWLFAVRATTEDGGRLIAEFEQEIERRR